MRQIVEQTAMKTLYIVFREAKQGTTVPYGITHDKPVQSPADTQRLQRYG